LKKPLVQNWKYRNCCREDCNRLSKLGSREDKMTIYIASYINDL
jgi:hypothetical protein